MSRSLDSSFDTREATAQPLSPDALDIDRPLGAPPGAGPSSEVASLLSDAKSLLNDPAYRDSVGSALSEVLHADDPATTELLTQAASGRSITREDRERFAELIDGRVRIEGIAELFAELDGHGVKDLLFELDGRQQQAIADALNRALYHHGSHASEPGASANRIIEEIAEHAYPSELLRFGMDFASFDGPQRALGSFLEDIRYVTSPATKAFVVEHYLDDFREFPSAVGPLYAQALGNLDSPPLLTPENVELFSRTVDRMGMDQFVTLLENSYGYSTNQYNLPTSLTSALGNLIFMTRYYDGNPPAGVTDADWTARVQAQTLLTADRILDQLPESRDTFSLAATMTYTLGHNANDIVTQLERQYDQDGRETTGMIGRLLNAGGNEGEAWIGHILGQVMTDNGTTTPLGLVEGSLDSTSERFDEGQAARNAGFIRAALENAILSQPTNERSFETAKNAIQTFAGIVAAVNPTVRIGVGVSTVSGMTDQIASGLAQDYVAQLKEERSDRAEALVSPFAPREANGDYAGGVWTGIYDGAYNRVRAAM